MRGLRTKKVNTIKEGTLIVAVDIGMVSNHGCCTTANGRKKKLGWESSNLFYVHVFALPQLTNPLLFQYHQMLKGFFLRNA